MGKFNDCLDQDCVGIEGQVGMQFKIFIRYGRGGVRKFVYNMDRPTTPPDPCSGLLISRARISMQMHVFI